jgi:hypothetical protein
MRFPPDQSISPRAKGITVVKHQRNLANADEDHHNAEQYGNELDHRKSSSPLVRSPISTALN